MMYVGIGLVLMVIAGGMRYALKRTGAPSDPRTVFVHEFFRLKKNGRFVVDKHTPAAGFGIGYVYTNNKRLCEAVNEGVRTLLCIHRMPRKETSRTETHLINRMDELHAAIKVMKEH